MSSSMRGSTFPWTASLSMIAWERLLMSSEVHAKCVNSSHGLELLDLCKPGLENVLYGLDVVVGRALDVLHGLGVLQAEVCCEVVQERIGGGAEGGDLLDLSSRSERGAGEEGHSGTSFGR